MLDPDLDISALRIVNYPDPVLRRPTQPLREINARVVELANTMLDLMRERSGVGLAAPQIGLGLRLFVMNPSGEPEDDRVVINPTIKSRKGKCVDVEGCLSLPEINGKITRARQITLHCFDLAGNECTEDLTEFPARVAQHEFDHLEGILIIDRMSQVERQLVERDLRELAHEYQREA